MNKLKRYSSQIPIHDFKPVLEKLVKWCNKYNKTSAKVGYYTRTSTKNIEFFITTDYPDRIDGYMLTGLILRMSEMNLRLEQMDHTEYYEDHLKKISNGYVLKFYGSSLGRGFNYVYCITNNIGDRIDPPPIITEDDYS